MNQYQLFADLKSLCVGLNMRHTATHCDTLRHTATYVRYAFVIFFVVSQLLAPDSHKPENNSFCVPIHFRVIF